MQASRSRYPRATTRWYTWTASRSARSHRMVHPPVSTELIDVDQVLRVDREHLIHPLYHPADHARPMVIVRGEGAEIIDANDKRYFDALSGLWNVHVGHGRTELAQVAA